MSVAPGALSEIGKVLVGLGAILLVLGVALLLSARLPWLGKLPGDIVWRRGKFTFYFPLVTCILLSLLLSLVAWLWRR